MTEYKYYVYAYVRSKDSKTAKAGTPYYIGKVLVVEHIKNTIHGLKLRMTNQKLLC